jgi:predicted secreted acid phosphatase
LLSEYASDDKQVHAVFDIDNTLIFDDNRETPNVQVKHLLEVARAHGCKIHLVTAREKSSEVTKWTRDELKRHGIPYDSLALSPKKSRSSMTEVAKWKHMERAKHTPVVLTVGDQWGDLIQLETDDHIDRLDKRHNALESPWLVMKCNDGVSEYGLKLMAV